MYDYYPDKWTIVELVTPEGEKIHKVFASWAGGYTSNDKWRLSSGITKIVEDGNCYMIHNESGSIYCCRKKSAGMTIWSVGIFNNLCEQMQELHATLNRVEFEDVRQLFM